MRSGVVIRMVVALVVVVAAAVVAVPATAHALTYERVYAFETQAPGIAAAVDRGTGNVYVAIGVDFSTFSGTIKRFDSAGDALTPGAFGAGNYGGVAFDPNADRVRALDTDLIAGVFGGTPAPTIDSFTSAGDPAGASIPVAAGGFDFNQIAVGPDGVIYYPNAVTDTVEKFAADGSPLGSIGGGDLVDPSSVAVRGSDLYVVDGVVNGGFAPDDPTNGRVRRFSTAGGPPLATIDAANASSVATDPTSGRVLVGNGLGASFEVVVYDQAGNQLTSFGAGRFGAEGFFGGFNNEIAVSQTGRVYVTDPGSNEVEMFDVLPTVTTGTAVAVDDDSATLRGSVDSNGSSVFSCRFEYGATAAYGQAVPCVTGSGSGSGPAEVSADVAGLAPSTTYHFRLVATNVGGTTAGSDATFVTDAAPIPPADPPEPPPAPTPPPPPTPPQCAANCGGEQAAAGRVTVPATAKVRGGRARIKVTCRGAAGAVCRGAVKLAAKFKVTPGRKAKRRRIGRTSCDLRAGSSIILRVALSRASRRALARRGSLRVAISAPGLPRKAIKLTGPKRRNRR